ncbi:MULTISPECIES: tripartite tricarboxylate transporter substrate binding protein [unclassified Bradyrhizobium]|uniref:Bug family tripartite tricarboxylate transporter substrate binding protein n=1 Tax=unclassified Bradyrhizobium TaxID=2631580 RepID=UPI0024799558|nr:MULTISPECIES: tripartite tricarboxylate transporter substrate binding protein [unclassified Bradyrhizobium]WGS18780.1 tripartite tricarboxylate transporter substrate binding protein [Bradyrhizobium sp. ISRA463]WGS25605.1 tripartite tricarboxylate transporter substrate binding protein [Bradyrhizobium sp. ISRA464]
MTPHRRQFLQLAAGAIALPAGSRLALAQTYPSRPIDLLVGFTAGGPTDVTARLIGQWLSERLGQPFIIENRPGAGSNLAAAAVARAPADGYTLLVVTSSNAINATLYDNLEFNFMRDIAPVAGIMRAPFTLVVNPSVPVKTLTEFIAYAKANPGKINMAITGIGTGSHISGELFNMMAGVTLVPIPYRGGGPALADLLAGQVQVMFEGIASVIGHIRAGRLRALAVTSAMRSAALPDLPSVGEFVPGYEVTAWFGIGAPKNTPAEIVAMLNREINAGLADRAVQERLASLGGAPIPMTPLEFGTLIADETAKWAKVIRTANIKPI